MLPVLRRGCAGRAVERLQERLATLGFSPGRIDGRFGPGTEAALLAFQRSSGLLPDAVCGAVTWSALDPSAEPPIGGVLAQVDVELVAEMFPHTRLGSIARNLPHVLAGLRAFGLTEKPLVLTALATIRAESERFEPVDEEPSRFNTSPGGMPFDLYDRRQDLGNQGAPDGERYHGRGFVQLTGRHNYAVLGRSLGLGEDLLARPERANEPDIAGRILAGFLFGRRLQIKEAVLDRDLRRARRLVNGGSHGLDRFQDAFRRGDRLLDDPVWPAARLSGPRAMATVDR